MRRGWETSPAVFRASDTARLGNLDSKGGALVNEARLGNLASGGVDFSDRDEVGKLRQRSLGLLIRRGWETSLMGARWGKRRGWETSSAVFRASDTARLGNFASGGVELFDRSEVRKPRQRGRGNATQKRRGVETAPLFIFKRASSVTNYRLEEVLCFNQEPL